MMIMGHPSRKALTAWLTGSFDPSLDRHLETCNRCAGTLESIDTGHDAPIGDALATLLTPPADLSARLTRRVARQLDSRIMFDVVSDLFGAGIETTRLLLSGEDGKDRDG